MSRSGTIMKKANKPDMTKHVLKDFQDDEFDDKKVDKSINSDEENAHPLRRHSSNATEMVLVRSEIDGGGFGGPDSDHKKSRIDSDG